MSFRIDCNELGVQNCNFTAKGETAGDVVRQVVAHLRAEHDIDMPDAEQILEGKASDDKLTRPDPDVEIIVKRLREALNIVPGHDPEMPFPPIAGTTAKSQ